jgi:hypothetical protein
VILLGKCLCVKPVAHALAWHKKSATTGVALNPPKEEGGGDKPRSAGITAHPAPTQVNYKDRFVALQGFPARRLIVFFIDA